MKHQFKTTIHSLFTKLLSAFLLLGFLPLLFVNFMWYHNTSRIVYQNELSNSQNLLNQLNVRLENVLNTINVNTYPFLFDRTVQDIIASVPAAPDVKRENEIILKNVLSQIKENNTMISSVSFINDFYKICSVDSGVNYDILEKEHWYQDFMTYGRTETFTPVYINSYIERRGTEVIGWMRRLNYSTSSQTAGNFLVEISYSTINSFLMPSIEGTDNTIMIFDTAGNLIFHPENNRLFSPDPDDKQLFQKLKAGETLFNFDYNGQEYTIVSNRLAITDWYLIMAIDTKTLLSSTTQAARRVNIITLFVLIGTVICSYLISRHITKPIFQLSDTMKKVEANQLDVTMPPSSSHDEISILSNGFNNMLSHIRSLLHDIRNEEQKKRDAELKMLQAQINPHFLYNTLNVIRWRAVMHNEITISKMIISLIKLLEFSGKKTDEYVPIEKELEHAQSYIDLIRYQYGDKFTVRYDTEASALSCYTIKFVLQPLVENAIFHGLIPMEETGELTIRIQAEAERIHFSVIDNGIGMDLTAPEHNPAFKGLGLSNVNERLCRYFGPDAALDIHSDNGAGTHIDFFIPAIQTPPGQGGYADA